MNFSIFSYELDVSLLKPTLIVLIGIIGMGVIVINRINENTHRVMCNVGNLTCSIDKLSRSLHLLHLEVMIEMKRIGNIKVEDEDEKIDENKDIHNSSVYEDDSSIYEDDDTPKLYDSCEEDMNLEIVPKISKIWEGCVKGGIVYSTIKDENTSIESTDLQVDISDLSVLGINTIDSTNLINTPRSGKKNLTIDSTMARVPFNTPATSSPIPNSSPQSSLDFNNGMNTPPSQKSLDEIEEKLLANDINVSFLDTEDHSTYISK
jgi:hypothetical protein